MNALIYHTSSHLPTGSTENGGYVYLVAKSEEGPVKFGITKLPRKRVKTLETGAGERFKHIWISVRCSNYEQIESDLFVLCHKRRTVGEWFDLPLWAGLKAIDKQKFNEVPEQFSMEHLRKVVNKCKPPPREVEARALALYGNEAPKHPAHAINTP